MVINLKTRPETTYECTLRIFISMIYDNLFEESVICRGKTASKLIYISINKDQEIVYAVQCI